MNFDQLLAQLKRDFSEIKFEPGDNFVCSNSQQTIYFDPSHSQAPALILHELSHWQLEHLDYNFDIELIKMETAAWDYAINQLAPRYNIEIDPDFAEEQLDSYRDWLYKRSLCPNCQSQGVQVKQETYLCPACNLKWSNNLAQFTRLRRSKK